MEQREKIPIGAIIKLQAHWRGAITRKYLSNTPMGKELYAQHDGRINDEIQEEDEEYMSSGDPKKHPDGYHYHEGMAMEGNMEAPAPQEVDI